MPRLLAATLAFCLSLAPSVVPAQSSVSDLSAALLLPETVEVMREEGLAYGSSLEDELFPGKGNAAWASEVARIYNADRMTEGLEDALSTLSDIHLEQLTAFFESEIGQRIIGLELSARRALLDDAVEDASHENLIEMIENKDPRLELIEEYSDANSLVDENVVGAMNANYAFYLGLRDGGAFPYDMSDEEILSDVWVQEPDIRMDTAEWVMSYLAMAYRPLSDEDLELYIEMSKTEAGRALNRVLFDGFDTIFTEISRALGNSASRYLVGEEI